MIHNLLGLACLIFLIVGGGMVLYTRHCVHGPIGKAWGALIALGCIALGVLAFIVWGIVA